MFAGIMKQFSLSYLLLESHTIDTKLLTDEITDSAGKTPVHAIETAQSIRNGLFNISWFVSFEAESHILLHKTL